MTKLKDFIKYRTAWFELLKRFDGAYDGVCYAAEQGSESATRDQKVYQDIEEIIKEIAEEHDIEGSVLDIEEPKGADLSDIFSEVKNDTEKA